MIKWNHEQVIFYLCELLAYIKSLLSYKNAISLVYYENVKCLHDYIQP